MRILLREDLLLHRLASSNNSKQVRTRQILKLGETTVKD